MQKGTDRVKGGEQRAVVTPQSCPESLNADSEPVGI